MLLFAIGVRKRSYSTAAEGITVKGNIRLLQNYAWSHRNKSHYATDKNKQSMYRRYSKWSETKLPSISFDRTKNDIYKVRIRKTCDNEEGKAQEQQNLELPAISHQLPPLLQHNLKAPAAFYMYYIWRSEPKL